jgi:hypothetical protein
VRSTSYTAIAVRSQQEPRRGGGLFHAHLSPSLTAHSNTGCSRGIGEAHKQHPAAAFERYFEFTFSEVSVFFCAFSQFKQCSWRVAIARGSLILSALDKIEALDSAELNPNTAQV